MDMCMCDRDCSLEIRERGRWMAVGVICCRGADHQASRAATSMREHATWLVEYE